MNAMLTKYLKDFSVAPQPSKSEPDLADSLSSSGFPDLDFSFEPEPAIDLEAERAAARQEGYDAAIADLSVKHSAEIEELQRLHTEELALLKRAHEQETVQQIHTRFHEMTREITETVTETTLEVLLPIFTAELCDVAIATLATQARELLQEAGTTAVTVRGPTTLYAKIKPLLAADGVEARFIEAATPDIAIEINDTLLVTRLETWAQALLEVSG